MLLLIDTKDQKKVTVSLKENGKDIKSLSKENEFGSQVLLPIIIELLSRTKKTKNPEVASGINLRGGIWKVIDEIEVETGPGSFTGLRVGVSVANSLGYSLGIPVNEKKLESDLVY